MEKEEYEAQIKALKEEIELLKKKQTYEIKRQKYGLNWIDVPEAFEKDSENKIPVLEEVKDKSIKNDDGKPTHILIEGDNYHALQCLNYTHKGKIDVIYIDPPYNTGSDGFSYKDARFLDKYPDGTSVPKDHPLRHSYWLSFMNKRLRLARKLLKPDGVIFISINEDELSQLKLLCDEIFLPENYISTFVIKVRHDDRILKGDKPIHETVEFLLMYQNSSSFQIQKRLKDNSSPEEYKYQIKELISNPEIIKMGEKNVQVFKPGDYEIITTSASFNNLKKINIRGSIKAGNSSGRFHMKYLENRKNDFEVLYKVPNMGDDGLGYRYFISRKNEKQLNGSYFQGAPIDRKDWTSIPYPNFFDFESIFNDVGQEGGVPFDGGKKPIEFIEKFIKIATAKENLVILDFFGGSGSTAHATLDMNSTANNQFIVVQIPEKTFEIKNNSKKALKGCENVFNAGFNNLIDVTYQRIKNVMQGYTNSKGEQIPGLGNSLKYYKTAFIGQNNCKNANDDDRTELAKKAGCLLSLGENTLDEICSTEYYQLFTGSKEATAVYFTDDYEKFDEFKEKVAELAPKFKKTFVYIFAWSSADDFAYEFEDIPNIQIKAIPLPILEIYKSIYNG